MQLAMWRDEKCSCFLLFFIQFYILTTNFACIEGASYRPKLAKPATNGSIITVRIGDDGFTKEECQCVSFWMCDAKNFYEDPNDPNPCGRDDLKCCKLPFTSLSDPSKPDRTSSSGDTQTCSEGICVDSSQCENYGAGKIDLRMSSCPGTKTCCSLSDVINTQTTPSSKPSFTETVSKYPDKYTPGGISSTKPSKLNCECVPYDRCVNYGQGILQVRSSMCKSDLEICCDPSDMLTVQSPKKYSCGYKKGDPLTNRIANNGANDVSEFGEFPWMSLILKKQGDKEEVVCGASLLSNQLLLTAAHCVHKIDKNSLIIRVGEHDTYLPPELESSPHEDGYVSDIHFPSNYRADTAFNDLALIKVKEPFELRENVVPICSPLTGAEFSQPDIYDPSQCIATGWGKEAYSKDAAYSKVLKKVDLLLVPKDQCQEQLRNTKLGPRFKLHDSFICAGGQPGKDTCKGDGGGPLICALRSDPNRYVQVGVTSWGIDCAKNYPAVYSSLIYNKEWLLTESNSHSIFKRR